MTHVSITVWLCRTCAWGVSCGLGDNRIALASEGSNIAHWCLHKVVIDLKVYVDFGTLRLPQSRQEYTRLRAAARLKLGAHMHYTVVPDLSRGRDEGADPIHIMLTTAVILCLVLQTRYVFFGIERPLRRCLLQFFRS